MGTILQLAGLALVGMGYIELRTHFGRPTAAESVRDYFRGFLAALRGRKLHLHGKVIGGTVPVSSHLAMKIIPAPTSSLERRVEILEDNFERLNKEVTGLRSEMTNKYSELTAQFSDEIATLKSRIQETKTLLENITVGGLGSEVIGWMWLLISTLISGFGPKPQ